MKTEGGKCEWQNKAACEKATRVVRFKKKCNNTGEDGKDNVGNDEMREKTGKMCEG